MNTNVARLVRTLPVWKQRISPWLAGKPVDDAPQCGKAHRRNMETGPNMLSFRGPFANVTLVRTGEGFIASVSGNANPVTCHYADTDEAVRRWASSVWHTAIRGVIGLIVLAMVIQMAQADDRREHGVRKVEHHDWVIERQTAGQVEGTPAIRRIVGKREIDVYSNGLMFEKGNVVGVTK